MVVLFAFLNLLEGTPSNPTTGLQSSLCVATLCLLQVFLDVLQATFSVQPETHRFCPEGAAGLTRPSNYVAVEPLPSTIS